jgi:YfiH family protein
MVPDIATGMTPLRAGSFIASPWVAHGFGTRHDGYWTPPAQTAKLHQVHGADVVVVTAAGQFGDGDALITASPGLWLEIRTADCVPVLVYDKRQKIVAAVHAGWRGTAAEITGVTIRTFLHNYASRSQDLFAAVGPRISACCFEVGDEVASHFPGYITQGYPRPHVDLGEANRAQLVGEGVPASQIEVLSHCTCCDAEQFHSFRRDKGNGRMVSSIAIRSAG